jgi:hypothetical protein
MPTFLLVAVALILAAYCLYTWTVMTWNVILDARQQRLKQHIDWNVERRRSSARSGRRTR